MSTGVDARNVERVLELYDMYNVECYSVWQGSKEIKFSYSPDDDYGMDAKEFLRQNLEAARQSGTTALYTIKFHKGLKEGEIISSKTPVTGSMNFRLNEPGGGVQQSGGGMMPGSYQDRYVSFLERRNDDLSAKVDKLTDIVNQLKEEIRDMMDQEDDIDKLDTVGRIARAGEQYPWIQDTIKDLASDLKFVFSKMFNRGFINRERGEAAMVAGVNDIDSLPTEKKVSKAIEMMMTSPHYKGRENEFCNDMAMLAKLSWNDPDAFEFAIGKLRKMQ